MSFIQSKGRSMEDEGKCEIVPRMFVEKTVSVERTARTARVNDGLEGDTMVSRT